MAPKVLMLLNSWFAHECVPDAGQAAHSLESKKEELTRVNGKYLQAACMRLVEGFKNTGPGRWLGQQVGHVELRWYTRG